MQQARNRVSGRWARAIAPIISRVDVRAGALEARLDSIDSCLAGLARRLDEIEVALQTTGARAAALTERSLASTESSLRLERRVAEIERLMGAPAADR